MYVDLFYKAFTNYNPVLVIFFITEVNNSIMWYRGTMPITNGNTTLLAGYEIDSKHSLYVYNYTSAETGNFSCSVLPGDIRQYVKVEFKTSVPENISEMNAAPGSMNAATGLIINYVHILAQLMLPLLALYY